MTTQQEYRVIRFFLLIDQAIYIPAIEHNLLSTMQVRHYGVIVNDSPRFLTDNLTDHTHALVIPVDDGDVPCVLPLSLQGVTCFLLSYAETDQHRRICIVAASPHDQRRRTI